MGTPTGATSQFLRHWHLPLFPTSIEVFPFAANWSIRKGKPDAREEGPKLVGESGRDCAISLMGQSSGGWVCLCESTCFLWVKLVRGGPCVKDERVVIRVTSSLSCLLSRVRRPCRNLLLWRRPHPWGRRYSQSFLGLISWNFPWWSRLRSFPQE